MPSFRLFLLGACAFLALVLLGPTGAAAQQQNGDGTYGGGGNQGNWTGGGGDQGGGGTYGGGEQGGGGAYGYPGGGNQGGGQPGGGEGGGQPGGGGGQPPPQPGGGGGNNVTSGGNATAFLPLTLSNNNSWVDTRTGGWHEQNNWLMQNTANRPICDVTLKTPLTDPNATRIYSSYNIDVHNTTARTMHFGFPWYLQKIWPGQVVSFGWILNSTANGTTTGGPATVTSAHFCDGDNQGGSAHLRRHRRHVLAVAGSWGR